MGPYLGPTQFLLNFYSVPNQALAATTKTLPKRTFPKRPHGSSESQKNAHRQLFEDLFPWAAR